MWNFTKRRWMTWGEVLVTLLSVSSAWGAACTASVAGNWSAAVTCTGTSASPADLYVWWTPTAPSGGTLNIIRLGVSY